MKKARRIDMDTKKLRQKILDLAIRGKLVPQDPNDEPASVLLERIRAEKERLIKEGKIKRSKKSTSDTPHYENDVPFEVPESWEWCQVSDIFELNPKNDVPDDTQSGFIPMVCVDDGFGYAHSFETRPWGEIRKGYSHFKNGDIGIAKISPCFENRKSTIFYDLPNGIGAGTTELTVLRGYCVNTEFFLYLFQSEWYLFEGTKEFKGVVGQQRVNKEIFTTLLIPLPPIEEQNRIVTEIRKLFSVIEVLDDDKEDLNESVQKAKSKILDLAVHGKLVTQDPNDEPAIELLKRINPKFAPCDNAHYENVPSNWTLARAEDIGMLLSGRDLTNDECNSEKKGLPYLIGASNIEGNTFSFIRWTEKPQVISQIEDILISCKGTIGAIVKNNIGDMHIARQFMAIRPNTNCIISDYLHICLIAAIEEIKKDARGVIPGIARDDILSKVFTIPPLNEQRRIIAALKQYYSILDNISANL